ncbi:uncharacterized protein BX663DRAFT_140473 [Cokeromyces recurvatus]|uniref:uncharacterized protein n=1 Tax=Cokeromyces recurvatus TaxID=90255 RepID=UPI002220A0DE|nr:uncharacterized protein BX663DRAFT_140473 [Cokeromyces recurvatus]KAI7900954.1 hypothetical protein BX663DRAFT_140473 [Cokeromyces recurvatus]
MSTLTDAKVDDKPRLVLRTYKASDHDQVDHLFYSTYFTLVPEGVKNKLKSPLFWVIWFAAYAYLLAIVPILLAGLNWPSWTYIALKLFLTFAWSIVSFASVFVITDRFEVVDKVEQARQNDLSDPEIYYLNWTKQEIEVKDDDNQIKTTMTTTTTTNTTTSNNNNNPNKKRVTFDKNAKPATELIRIQRPLEEQTPSHFWVLTLDNKPCGMVGLAHYRERILSNRPLQPPAWKLLLAAACQRYHLPLPVWLRDLQGQMPTPVFAEPHEPKVATLQRLAVRTDYQGCGLSTLLIDRVMSWADEHGLERVEANTNELESQAANILRLKHGFKLIKKVKKGWFGQYEKTWSCDVKEWMKAHELGASTYIKKKNDR